MKPVRWLAMATVVAALLSFVGVNDTMAKRNYKYPEARMGDVVDDYHGTAVPDPYRWLEDPDSPETMAWVEKENELTRSYIEAYPGREAIARRITDLWNYERYGVPEQHGGRYFYERNDGLQNQAVLYMAKSLGEEPVVLLDPNTWSEDGTTALTNDRYSHDGKLLAYGRSGSGSDWQEIRIRDIDKGTDSDEVLNWCKFSGIGWKNDNSGFWYSRFPADGEVPKEDRNNYSRVYWHTLGTPQTQDKLVYSDDEHKELGFWPFTTDDGAWLVIWVYHGTDPRNGIYYRPTDSDGEFVRLIEHEEAKFTPIDNVGSVFYFLTDLDAPRGRVIAVDVDNPARENWREVVAESDDVIDKVLTAGERLVVSRMHDAHHRLTIHTLDGEMESEIELPTIGSVETISGKRTDMEMFFSFESYVYPKAIYRYDFATKKATAFREPKIDFDSGAYETRQVFYHSKDGTRVPMFVTAKKGIALNGDNPAWLYGYGGFNISLPPSFRISRLLWLEKGGVYAVANIRGGDEYGEEWHQGGILDRKQNVFDDFIAAAQYLIAEKYTRSEKLFISGGSNGGLLVAACMIQRPELFGAIVCQVPVIDMLRYHKFTVGRYWVSDYGNAEENPEHFKFLMEYSPLHNIEEGATYPPTLITTADTDDRVVPAHAKKFAAALQKADSGENPLLIRVETKAGHGAGKPTTKVIEELADIYSFVFRTFAIEPDL